MKGEEIGNRKRGHRKVKIYMKRRRGKDETLLQRGTDGESPEGSGDGGKEEWEEDKIVKKI